MPLYRKKPITVPAHQWFKNGDHPEDESYWIQAQNRRGFLSEGKVVRRYNYPEGSKGGPCGHCTFPLLDHGWIDTLEGGHIVCPGDFIITGVKGERYPCKPDIFIRSYEPVDEAGNVISWTDKALASITPAPLA